jgi:hypothetical protein
MQQTLRECTNDAADAGRVLKVRKTTRRAQFLAEMEQVMCRGRNCMP